MESSENPEATEAHPSYIPGDPELIDKMVFQLKLQGIFDEFRRDCLADVDTKPAYQNLRQRVDNSVQGFLNGTTWSASLNKKNVRENLRKHVYDCKFLDLGVERIVEQVVNPKIRSVFMPKVEQVVYQFLGIKVEPKPETESNKWSIGIDKVKSGHMFSNIKGEPFALLPEELEPISPDHDVFSDNEDTKGGIKRTKDSTKEIKEELKAIKEEDLSVSGNDVSGKVAKESDDVSPDFEPHHPNKDENSAGSDLSGISDLGSLSGSPKRNDFSDFNKKIRKESTEEKLLLSEDIISGDKKDTDLDESEPMIDASAISPLTSSSIGSVDDSPESKVIFSFEKPFIETCASNSSIKSAKSFDGKFSTHDDDKTSDSDKLNCFSMNNRTPLHGKSPSDVETTQSSFALKIHEDENSRRSLKIQEDDNSRRSLKIQEDDNSHRSLKIQEDDNSRGSLKIQEDDNIPRSLNIQEDDNSRGSLKIQEDHNSHKSLNTQEDNNSCRNWKIHEDDNSCKSPKILEDTCSNKNHQDENVAENEENIFVQTDVEVKETTVTTNEPSVSKNEDSSNVINDESRYHHIDNDSLLLEYCHDQIEQSEDLSLPKTPTIHYENSNGSIEFDSVGELKESIKKNQEKSSTVDEHSLTSFEDCLSKTGIFKGKKPSEDSSPSIGKQTEESNYSENSSTSFKDNTGSDEINSRNETLKLYNQNSKEKDKKMEHHSHKSHSSRKDSHSSSKDYRKSHSSRSSSKDVKDGSSSKERDSKSSRDHSSSKDSKESRLSKDSKEHKSSRDFKDLKVSKDVKSSRDPKTSKDSKDHSSSKEPKEHSTKDGKEHFSQKDGIELLNSKDGKESSSSKDARKHVSSKDHHQSSSKDRDRSKDSKNHHSTSKESKDSSKHSSKYHKSKESSSKDSPSLEKDRSLSKDRNHHSSSKELHHHSDDNKLSKEISKKSLSCKDEIKKTSSSSDKKSIEKSNKEHKRPEKINKDRKNKDQCSSMTVSRESRRSSDRDNDGSASSSHRHSKSSHQLHGTRETSRIDETSKKSHKSSHKQADSSSKQSDSNQIKTFILYPVLKSSNSNDHVPDLESIKAVMPHHATTSGGTAETKMEDDTNKNDDQIFASETPSPLISFDKTPRIILKRCSVDSHDSRHLNDHCFKSASGTTNEANDSTDDENVEVDPEYLALINASESKTKSETASKKPKIAADLSELRGKIKERKMFNKRLIKRQSEEENVTSDVVVSKRVKETHDEDELLSADSFESNVSADLTSIQDTSESQKAVWDENHDEIKGNSLNTTMDSSLSSDISESHKIMLSVNQNRRKDDTSIASIDSSVFQDVPEPHKAALSKNQTEVKENSSTSVVNNAPESLKIAPDTIMQEMEENASNECLTSSSKLKTECIENLVKPSSVSEIKTEFTVSTIDSELGSPLATDQSSIAEEKTVVIEEQIPETSESMDTVTKDEWTELAFYLTNEELKKTDPKELYQQWREHMLSKLIASVDGDISHLEQNSNLHNYINTQFLNYLKSFEKRFSSELKEMKVHYSTDFFNFDSSLDSILSDKFNFIVERNSYISVPAVSSADYLYDEASNSYTLKGSVSKFSKEQIPPSNIVKLKRKGSDCVTDENSLCNQSIPKKIKICGLTTGDLQVAPLPLTLQTLAENSTTRSDKNCSELENKFASPSKSSAVESYDLDKDNPETSHLNESISSPKYDPDSSIDDGSVLNTPSKILTTQLIEPALESLLAESGLAPVRPIGLNLDSVAVNSDEREGISPFNLPLTPESDTVLTHVSPPKSSKRHSGESNSSSKKKASPLSGKSTPPMKQRNALVESSMGKLQRYDNSDLYKPRPLFSQTSRRTRTSNSSGRNSIGVENESDNALNPNLIGKKR